MGAPVCAEYLSAYLSSTGKPFELLGGLTFFTPLYGGAALIIREVAVRRGMGWPGRLLLAAAFGVLMTSVIDLSVWTVHRPDVEYWDQLQTTTRLDSLGFAVYPALVWVLGHVVLSISVPTAIVEALAGGIRHERWLRLPGLAVWSVLFVAVAVSIHASEGEEYDVHPSPAQYTSALILVALLVIAAFSRWGLPLERQDRRPPGLVLALLGGIALMACFDFAPIDWGGVALVVVAAALAVVALRRWGCAPRWTGRQVSAIAVGALVLRTFTSFLAPVPEGVDPTAKLLQSVVVVVLVAGLGVWLWRASWSGRHAATGTMSP